MEPFTIQCSTCGSNIRVRNPKLVGQLANCPKCQAMIMIAAPGQVTVEPNRGAVVDSQAMTKEVVAGHDFEAPVSGVTDDPTQDSELGDEYRLAPATSGAGNQDATTQAEQIAWQPADTPLVPSDQWTSASSTQSRHFLLIGVLGFASVLLAIGGFFAFLNWYQKSPEVANQDTTSVSGNPLEQQPDPVGAAAGTDDESIDNANANIEGDPLDTGDASGNDNPNNSPPASAETESEEPEPATEIPSAPDSDPALEIDPNSVAHADGSELPDGLADPVPPAGGPGTNQDPIKQLESFKGLLEYQVQLSPPDEGVIPSEPPVTAADLGLATTVARPPLQPFDILQQMDKVLPGLVVQGQPPSLNRLLNLWTHLSGIPVVVDFDSFAAAGLDRNQTVKLPLLVNKTMGQVTDTIANLVGAKVRIIENRYVLLQAAAEQLQANLPTTYPLEGLVTEEEQPWLEATLAEFFPDVSPGLKFEPAELSFDATTVDLTSWLQVVQLLETWRAAKGLEPVVATPTHGDFVSHFVMHEDIQALEHQGTIISPQSRPVGQALPKVCAAAGLNCWIDWSSVGSVGLGPETAEVVVTHGRPLKRVLANYAEMFPLVVAIVDQSSLLLMSPQAYRASVQSYVVPAEGLTAKQWQSRLRSLTPAGENQISSVQAHLSPDGSFVLLRCCRPAVDLNR